MYTQDIAAEYQNFLDQWQWHLHLTLSFRRPHHRQAALKAARGYLNKLKKEQPKMRFASALLATIGHGRNHVHALLLCDEKYPVTFQKLSFSDVTHHWEYGSDGKKGSGIGSARMTTSNEWSNETITKYLTKRKNLNLHDPDSYDLSFYRPQLLRQFRRTENAF